MAGPPVGFELDDLNIYSVAGADSNNPVVIKDDSLLADLPFATAPVLEMWATVRGQRTGGDPFGALRCVIQVRLDTSPNWIDWFTYGFGATADTRVSSAGLNALLGSLGDGELATSIRYRIIAYGDGFPTGEGFIEGIRIRGRVVPS